MSKYRNIVFHDYKSPFLVIFSSNYWHRLVLKIPFPDHISLKISKYRTENFISRPTENTPMGVLLYIFCNFSEYLFLRTSLDGCFCMQFTLSLCSCKYCSFNTRVSKYNTNYSFSQINVASNTLRSRIDVSPPRLIYFEKKSDPPSPPPLLVKCKQRINFQILFSNLFFSISNVLKT